MQDLLIERAILYATILEISGKSDDETPHIQKLELCIALSRSVLDSKGVGELFNSAALPAQHTACAVRKS